MPFAALSSPRAPTAMVRPSRLSAMELPNSSNASLFEPFTYDRCVHCVPARPNRYTAPASCAESSACLPLMPCAALSSSCAETARVLPSPLICRRDPNQSSFPGLEALKYACCAHCDPWRTNTTAAPTDVSSVMSLSHGADGFTPAATQSSSRIPPAMVLPSSLIETMTPSESLASAFDAFRYDCNVHVEPERV